MSSAEFETKFLVRFNLFRLNRLRAQTYRWATDGTVNAKSDSTTDRAALCLERAALLTAFTTVLLP